MYNVDVDELNANEALLDSMLFRMIQISENANKIVKGNQNKFINIAMSFC